MDNIDWGMKDRLSKIFNPKTGKTVMLAFDHGYIMGSTSGLERLDLVLPDLLEEVDCIMGTRGAIRTCVPPIYNKGVALRCSAGSSVLDDDMSFEVMLILGVFISVVGIVNIKGNISTIHSYNRRKVKEEDIPKYGKTVGTGTLIIGI